MSKAKVAAISFAANPPAQTSFTPASYKLIRAQNHGRSRSRFNPYEPGTEWVHAESEEKALQGVTFDPHEKGDLVVVAYVHRSHSISKAVKSEAYETWHVARRATTARAEKQLVDLMTGGKPVERNSGQVWRITYPHLQAAARLVGRTFDSRAALEEALDETQRAAEALEDFNYVGSRHHY